MCKQRLGLASINGLEYRISKGQYVGPFSTGQSEYLGRYNYSDLEDWAECNTVGGVQHVDFLIFKLRYFRILV